MDAAAAGKVSDLLKGVVVEICQLTVAHSATLVLHGVLHIQADGTQVCSVQFQENLAKSSVVNSSENATGSATPTSPVVSNRGLHASRGLSTSQTSLLNSLVKEAMQVWYDESPSPERTNRCTPSPAGLVKSSDESQSQALKPARNKNGMYQCSTCQKEFSFGTNLTRHQRNFHGRPQKRKAKGTESSESSTDTDSLVVLATAATGVPPAILSVPTLVLSKHVPTQHSHVCSVCPESFTSVTDLRDHCNVAHRTAATATAPLVSVTRQEDIAETFTVSCDDYEDNGGDDDGDEEDANVTADADSERQGGTGSTQGPVTMVAQVSQTSVTLQSLVPGTSASSTSLGCVTSQSPQSTSNTLTSQALIIAPAAYTLTSQSLLSIPSSLTSPQSFAPISNMPNTLTSQSFAPISNTPNTLTSQSIVPISNTLTSQSFAPISNMPNTLTSQSLVPISNTLTSPSFAPLSNSLRAQNFAPISNTLAPQSLVPIPNALTSPIHATLTSLSTTPIPNATSSLLTQNTLALTSLSAGPISSNLTSQTTIAVPISQMPQRSAAPVPSTPSQSLVPIPSGAEKPDKYECSICKQRFPLYRNLGRHLKKKHKTSLMDLEMQGKSHMYDTTVQKAGSYQCQLCSHRFTFTSNLRRHMTSVHGYPVQSRKPQGKEKASRPSPDTDAAASKDDDGQARIRRYQCEMCNAAFSFTSNLTRHLRKEHKMVRASSLALWDQPHTLQRAPPVSKGSTEAVASKSVDKKTMTLPVARPGSPKRPVVSPTGQTAMQSPPQKLHKSPPEAQTQKSPGSRYRFKCDVCDSAFTFRTNLTRHMKKVHDTVPDVSGREGFAENNLASPQIVGVN